MPTNHAAARLDGVRALESWQGGLTYQGDPAATRHEAAAVLHLVFPNLQFSLADVEAVDAGMGVWIVPVPRSVSLILSFTGDDFAWSEAVTDGDGHEVLASVIIETP